MPESFGLRSRPNCNVAERKIEHICRDGGVLVDRLWQGLAPRREAPRSMRSMSVRIESQGVGELLSWTMRNAVEQGLGSDEETPISYKRSEHKYLYCVRVIVSLL